MPERFGEQFIHEKEPKLHTTEPVEHEQKRRKRKGEKTSQKPTEKISAWLEIIKQTHTGHREDPAVMERIKGYYHKKHVIRPEDIPESYFENQKRLARERGHGEIEITDEMRRQLVEVIVNDQESTLDNWVDYFSSPDADSYPMWAKYWAFTNMLKLSTFDKEKHAFGKRDKGTVAPFPDLNREAMAYVVDVIVKKAKKEKVQAAEDNPEFKKILQGESFSKLYAWAIEKVTPAEESELKSAAGEWKKFDRNSDHMPLVESLQGYGTGWCTAGESTAEAQLKSGDFHIYYSYDKDGKPTVPRIAIRMEKGNIAEVRGIAPDQNLDPYIGKVVEKKLTEFPDGKTYQKKSVDMERLTEIDKKNSAGKELAKDDLRFLYEMDFKIQGFGYKEDPRIKEILDKRDIKADLSLVTGFPKEQISTNELEVLCGNIRFHYGDLSFSIVPSAKGLKLPESVSGSLDLNSLTSAEGLKLPESIGGGLYLSRLTSAEGLKLPESVGGSLDLQSLTSAEGLKLPESIGGTLYLQSLTSAEDLKLPESVGGDLDLQRLTSAEGLKFPESVGGSIDLRGLTSAEGLKLPESVAVTLYLQSLTSAEDLKLPESVGGDLDLNSLTSAEGLKLPESIGGSLDLNSLTSAKGLKLPESVGGGIGLRGLTSAEGLKLPESVAGSLDLQSLTSAEDLKFPKSVGGHLFLSRLTSAKGLKLPESVGGDLHLNSLTSAEGLKFPESVGGSLDLNSLTSAEGLKLPESVGGGLYFNSFPSAEKEKLRKKYPKFKDKIF